MAPFGPHQPLGLAGLLADIRRRPTVLGQLAYLAGLRDPNTGNYLHSGITEPTLRRQAGHELQRLHESIFQNWLSLRLQEQMADFDLHISGIPCGKATVVRAWTTLETYRTFLPASASPAERKLYHSNMRVLLGLRSSAASEAASRVDLPSANEPVLTLTEVSLWLRVPARTLRLWAEMGEIPAFKLGRRWRFRRTDVEEWQALTIKSRKDR
jgi:excisionase family DNA binding protein